MHATNDHQAPPERALRGKLRIYFGAHAGVGQTNAMLRAARALKEQGQRVMLGAVDGRGAREVDALSAGFELLPRNAGAAAGEFDLDAALAQRPALLLLDDLAHGNAPGARHPQRWQDSAELLAAGIDVFATLHVGQLESLRDVVADITGAGTARTVPDTVFDSADEVVLVDLAQEDASTGPRKDRLAALRELALRRAADRMENDVQAHRNKTPLSPLWKTNAALLACVGPYPEAQQVVRSAARLANQVNAKWHAVYIETPALQRLPEERRAGILQTLELARSLGANAALVAGNDIAWAIADYARRENLSNIILGRGRRTWHYPWHTGSRARIAMYAPESDLIEVAYGKSEEASASLEQRVLLPQPDADQPDAAPSGRTSRRQRYLLATGASLLTALISAPLLPYIDITNIAMLFLLTVVLVSMRFGREASAVATVVGVAAIVLATPRFSFDTGGLQYSVAFLVMLAVGLITGGLTADLRYQARVAVRREARTRSLYEFARALSAALRMEQVMDITGAFVEHTYAARASLLLPDRAGRLQYPAPAKEAARAVHLSVLDMATAQWAFDRAVAAGAGTDTLPSGRLFYLPLVAPMRTRGVLAIQTKYDRWVLAPEQRQQLDTVGALAAIALERVHYVEVAQDAMVSMESERLRNSLLSALSHDLRTPLTSLVGLSESLAMSKPALAAAQREAAEALRDEAIRMNTLVSNLLDMARMQSGRVQLDLQWQAIVEVVGSALRARRKPLAQHTVQTRLGRDLPLVRYDAVLIERVLCNLLENAAKYTPPGSRITIQVRTDGPWLEVSVSDNGAGLPQGKEEAIFEKFTRGKHESAIPGIGLGLAICRAIVEAHGGAISAQDAAGGGASFRFTLPLGAPPAFDAMDETENGQESAGSAAQPEEL